MKQLTRVFAAMEGGAMTSTEAAELTGLSVKRCSSHLSELCKYGLVVKTGRTVQYARRGNQSNCYEVVHA